MNRNRPFILGIIGVVWIVSTTFAINVFTTDLRHMRERVATLEDQMFTVCITGGCEE
jgi:hypothetical protein